MNKKTHKRSRNAHPALQKILLSGVGVLLIPIAVGLLRTLRQLLHLFPLKQAPEVFSLPGPIGAFLAGVVLFGILFVSVALPMRWYVWIHELTHALFALLSFSRVSRLKIAEEQGSIIVEKPNLLGLLAPYFFPLPAMAALLLLALLSFLWPVTDTLFGTFAAAVSGFLWGHHFCYTVNALSQHQSDLDAYGFFFSFCFLSVLNLLMLVILLGAFFPVGGAALLLLCLENSLDTFIFVWDMLWGAHGSVLEFPLPEM